MVKFNLPGGTAAKAHDSTYDSLSDTNKTTTSTSFVDVPDVDASIATDGSKVLVILTGMCWHSADNGDVFIRITRDNETANTLDIQVELKTANIRVPFCISWIDTPGSGTILYEPQFRTSVGGNTATVRDLTLSVVELKNAD